MYFFRSTLLTLLSSSFLVSAQDQPNPFKIPSGGLRATGGQALDLEWTPTTDGTVSLILRQGASDNLSEGTVIASKIDNSGSYTWTPSNSLTKGNDYAVEIVDDSNPDLVNYTPPFTLDTTTTEPQSTGTVTLGAPTTALDLSSASSAGGGTTSTSSRFTLPVVNTFTMKTGTGTATSSTTGSNSSPPGAATASTSSEGGAARATAMVAGMIGVALGALAL